MNILETEITIPGIFSTPDSPPLENLATAIAAHVPEPQHVVRFVIARSRAGTLECEMAVADTGFDPQLPTIFSFRQRAYEDSSSFNCVFLVPTGIGADLGGHSGDAGPAGKLLAACCDSLITHPNVGNAADINELPDNALYVEGSIISDVMMGTAGLSKVRSNRLLLVMENHPDRRFMDATVNMASAARAAAGIEVTRVIVLPHNFLMRSEYTASGRAAGVVAGLEAVCESLDRWRAEYDAVAISSVIQVPKHFHQDYFADQEDRMVNPWGGVEAMLTHTLSRRYRVPTAHAPMMSSRDVQALDLGPVDPRKAAEPVSTTYLFSVLKGLHRSPRILEPRLATGTPNCITAENIHCLIIPDGCVGLPTLAALQQGIPVIAVRGNRNRMKNCLSELPFPPGKLHFADNYLEAAGILTALRAGLAIDSVRRPLAPTQVTVETEVRSPP